MNFWINNFKIGIVLSAIVAAILFLLTYWLGNNNLFLLVNGNLGKAADNFFAVYTYLGDGACWLLCLLLFLLFKKKKEILLLVFGFTYTTIITQLFKYIILPLEPRPITAITNKALIHTVEGVDVYLISSFPSGHTTTAFTIYLFACIMFNNKWVVYLGFIPTLLVGYSRVYLAEHFPRDVAGGIVTAIICSVLSVITYQAIQKRRDRKKALA